MPKEINYPVAVRALEKWKNNNLDILDRSNGAVHFRFRFTGSTCNNGGTPFNAFLHAVFNSSEMDPHVSKAWIEIPEDQMENVGEMCGFKQQGEEFLAKLSDFEKMRGRSVSEILGQTIDLNHAGCFCTEPMINQKWRMALSTMYYALAQEE
jgi:hypothetical protein